MLEILRDVFENHQHLSQVCVENCGDYVEQYLQTVDWLISKLNICLIYQEVLIKTKTIAMQTHSCTVAVRSETFPIEKCDCCRRKVWKSLFCDSTAGVEAILFTYDNWSRWRDEGPILSPGPHVYVFRRTVGSRGRNGQFTELNEIKFVANIQWSSRY